jgi:pilus assembly protein Flp/PilA
MSEALFQCGRFPAQGGPAAFTSRRAGVSPVFVPRNVIPHRRDTRETMKNLANRIKKFLKSEDGPTAVEYAVMLALIVIVCLVSITAIGNNANQTFDSVAQALTAAS